MGQDSSGSYALSDTKNNILGIALEGYLKAIQDVINRDLVPQTLALNGWRFSAEDMPKLQFGEVEARNLDDLSKFVQRTAASGALSVDTKLDNALRKAADLPEADYGSPMPASANEGNTSRSGDGLTEGMPSGTGDADGSNGDDSVSNNENA